MKPMRSPASLKAWPEALPLSFPLSKFERAMPRLLGPPA